MQPSINLTAGMFRGGEIEPGTFHSVGNNANGTLSAIRSDESTSSERPVLTEDTEEEALFE